MGSTLFVILLAFAVVTDASTTTTTEIITTSIASTDATSTITETDTVSSNSASSALSSSTSRKTATGSLVVVTTGKPVVVDGDGGKNDTWRPKCKSMHEFINADPECEDHKSTIVWRHVEDLLLDVVFGISSCLSVFGSGFIMVTFIAIKRVRTFSFQIVFCLCLCDFLSSLAGLWGLHFDHSDLVHPTARCYVAAAFIQFFDIGTFCWVSIIAVNIWLSVAKKKNTSNLFIWYHVSAWGTSFLLTLLPALIHSAGFGPSFGYAGGGNWCWISDNEWLSRLIFFYAWLVAAIILVNVLFSLSSRAMQASEMDQSIAKAFICKLKIYVLIFSFVRTLGLVDTVIRALNPCCPVFGITVIMSFIAPLLGVANAAIFGFNKTVRAAYRETCCREQRTVVYKEQEVPEAAPRCSTISTPEKKK